jgi:hypothetical protein
VSDLDCFLVGARGATRFEKLPEPQVQLIHWEVGFSSPRRAATAPLFIPPASRLAATSARCAARPLNDIVLMDHLWRHRHWWLPQLDNIEVLLDRARDLIESEGAGGDEAEITPWMDAWQERLKLADQAKFKPPEVGLAAAAPSARLASMPDPPFNPFMATPEPCPRTVSHRRASSGTAMRRRSRSWRRP